MQHILSVNSSDYLGYIPNVNGSNLMRYINVSKREKLERGNRFLGHDVVLFFCYQGQR